MCNLLKDVRLWYGLALVTVSVAGASAGAPGQQTAAQGPTCRVDGRVISGRDPLPGVSITVHSGDALKAATSTDLDGKFTILFAPNAAYRLTADLTAFTPVDRTITLGPPPCDTTADFQLALQPRRPALAQAGLAGEAGRAGEVARTGGAGRAGGAGRGGRGTGFQTLQVQGDANTEAALGLLSAGDDANDAARLLPSGFSLQDAQADAVAISGNSDATSVDRGQLNDRLQAITQGQFDPATGQFAQGFGPQALGDGAGAQGPGLGGPGGGRGGGPGGGPGGFFLGGRGARGQNPYQGNATYTFGGSALNTAPYQINPNVPATQPQFAQNTFGTTFGGPLKIPGIYKDTNRRTNFQLNYTGNRSNNVFDQYATVPTQAMRSGDFSAAGIQLVNPATGQPFAGNQIPASQISSSARYLLGFIPQANLPGDQLNYHTSATTNTKSDAVSIRFTQNLSATVPQNGRGGRGGGRGGGGGFGGFGGGPGGPGGAGRQGQRGTNIVLNGQLQFRRSENDTLNVFPGLGSHTLNQSVTVPISLNVVRNRFINNFSVNLTHSSIDTTNGFAGVQNVGALAGINYPAGASTDPQYWGVPRLSFTGLTGVTGAQANSRSDTRLTASYTWSHPTQKHQWRLGGDVRIDRDTSLLNVNGAGMFTFTGLYSSGGAALTRSATAASSAGFADFLLGLPQQATLQVGGLSELRGRSFDAYFEDNWQKSTKLTVNYGVRYELVMPFTDVNGHLVNLDAAPGFTAVAPVTAGGTGLFSGAFPGGLINADTNNVGPRIGVAYRPVRGTIVRAGYSITYNPNTYATIARRLASQPQAGFDVTETVTGSLAQPLSIENGLLGAQSSGLVENNWGVDRSFALGLVQTWNASVSRDLTPTWNVLVGYTGIKGTDLDLLSAPDRGPDGSLLIPGVQPFTWESSEGHSLLNQGNVVLTRRLSHGFGGTASYTLSKSMDDTPSLGGASTIVEQDPKNPDAEWALSNFDRRQQFAANLTAELPFGPGRRWLDNTGLLASTVGGWTATLAFTAQSGTPFSARVCGATTDIAQGTNCSLRADVTGAPIALATPTIGEFFNNQTAFTVPTLGTYGNSARNLIIGPGGHQLNGTLLRNIPLKGNRAMTIQINAINLLNTVQWTTLDTDFNSPTFGHVLAVRPMRSLTATMRFRF